MLLGIDFDNTIVCYDRLFHRLAFERGWIPEELRAAKNSVRDYLRAEDRENDWTLLQGIAYGSRIDEAAPFDGVKEFLHCCQIEEMPFRIVSHKTRRPYRGPRHDLHQAALGWLHAHQLLDNPNIDLTENNVFLEETKQAKLARIAAAGCTHFIDDLPEFLLEPDFPPGVRRILFDPADRHDDHPDLLRLTSWQAVEHHFFPRSAP